MTTPVLNWLVEITGHHLMSVGRDEDHVLDTHAEFSREIDPRLHRDHHARPQDRLAFGGNRRGFVDLEADAVSRAMAEVLRVPVFLDHGAAGGVDFPRGNAGTGLSDTGPLSLPHDAVDFLMQGAYFTQKD